MRPRLDLDYCPVCDLPTFDHEEVALAGGEFLHRFCLDGSVMVAKKERLIQLPEPTE